MSDQSELTVEGAADLLNVSLAFLISLIENGELPFHVRGTQQRVCVADLMAYKGRNEAAREAALRELVALSQELKLGY